MRNAANSNEYECLISGYFRSLGRDISDCYSRSLNIRDPVQPPSRETIQRISMLPQHGCEEERMPRKGITNLSLKKHDFSVLTKEAATYYKGGEQSQKWKFLNSTDFLLSNPKILKAIKCRLASLPAPLISIFVF